MALTEFPIEVTEPKVDVVLPIGTHELELVVEDSMGLRSAPETVTVTVLQEAAVPVIKGIAPDSGEPGDEFKAVISGEDLDGASKVAFLRGGGADSTVTAVIDKVASDRLDVTVSIGNTASPGKRDLTVTATAGTVVGTGIFTVKAAPAEKPVVEGIEPDSGEPGDEFEATIYGANLDDPSEVVFLLGWEADETVWKPDEMIKVDIIETSPEKLGVVVGISPDAPPGERVLTVTTPAGTGVSAKPFIVKGEPAEMPVITGIEPKSGMQGETLEKVLIAGKNLEGVTDVRFFLAEAEMWDKGVVADIQNVGSEGIAVTIQIAADAKPGERRFTVTTPAGTAQSPADVFFTVEGEVGAEPSIESIKPESGIQGESLGAVIEGDNLQKATAIEFFPLLTSGIVAADERIVAKLAEVIDDRTIAIDVQIAADAVPGARSFRVTTPVGTAHSPAGVTFTVEEVPVSSVIEGILPTSGGEGENWAVIYGAEPLVVSGAKDVTFLLNGEPDKNVTCIQAAGGVEGREMLEALLAGGYFDLTEKEFELMISLPAPLVIRIGVDSAAVPGARSFMVGSLKSPAGVTFTVEGGLKPVRTTEEVSGIGPTSAARLAEAGVTDLGKLAAAKPVFVAETLGISEEHALEFVTGAKRLLGVPEVKLSGRSVEEVSGIGPAAAARLAEVGITDLTELAALEPARVVKMLEISEDRAKEYIEAAKKLLG